MRRIHLGLLAILPLCKARSRSFSIHEDLLAFPQFEVVFSDSFISEKDAQVLLELESPHPTYSADFSHPTVGDAAAPTDDDHDAGPATPSGIPLAYELINMAPHRYLCSIPVLEAPGPENQTATELAKAEEARELSRAAVSGWDLLSELEESCLYFMSGWWSYRFCNNREIVQFHALPSTPSGQPPRRDPETAEYVLGRAAAVPAKTETLSRPKQPKADETKMPAELQVKGDQRYLVQRLEGGTICDLTGRERTIEIQYHCVPGMQGDRIGWIKEVTICAYVMVVNTARLCDVVAFLPPEQNKAHPITCQLISDGERPTPPLLEQSKPQFKVPDTDTEEVPEGEEQEGEEQGEGEGDEEGEKQEVAAPELNVGGVIIGGRKLTSGADEAGKPPVKLAPPRNYFQGNNAAEERLIEVLVKAASKEDGGAVEALSAEELEKLDLKPEVIEEMRERMRKLAGDAGWQLEIVELPGEDLRELRGYLNNGEEADDDADAAIGDADAGSLAKGDQGVKETKKKAKKGKGNGDDEGSEEKFFKEEL